MLVSKDGISEPLWKGVVGALYGCSIIAAAVHIAFKLRNYRRLQTEDIFLLLACGFLTISTALIYRLSSSEFLIAESFGYPEISLIKSQPALAKSVSLYQRENYTFLGIIWGTIFSVKFSFLFFFKHFINRLDRIVTFWKIVMVITIVSFVCCIISFLTVCAHFGTSALSACRMSHKLFERALEDYPQDRHCILTSSVLVIPTYMIWKTRVGPVQKLTMGVLFCLSICMIAAGSIRVAGYHLDGNFIDIELDMKRSHFWLHVEGCIAVLTVSATAWKTVFAQSCRSPNSAQNDDDRPNRPRATQSISRPFDPATVNDENNGVLPLIPRATLTGMCTVIRADPPRAHLETDTTRGTSYFRLPLDQGGKQIRVTRELTSRSETASRHGDPTADGFV